MSDQAPPGLYHPTPGQPPQDGSPQGPGGPDGPAPQKHHRLRNTILGVLGLAVIVIVIVVAISGGGGSTTPSRSGATPGVSGSLPPRHAPPTKGIGASFAARDASGSGYRVRLDLILDPAQAAGKSASPGHGLRFVGVVLTLKAAGGSLRIQNVRHDAAVIGSNGRAYKPAVARVAGYTGFRQGRIALARGASVTGAVTFTLPSGVTVSTVEWRPAPGSLIRWPVR